MIRDKKKATRQATVEGVASPFICKDARGGLRQGKVTTHAIWISKTSLIGSKRVSCNTFIILFAITQRSRY